MPQPSARRAGLLSRVGTTLSTSFDAGVPLRDVQETASHADRAPPERTRTSLDRHATYIVAAYLAGAAQKDSSKLSIRRARTGQADQQHPT
jgi:integrase/recombinase XerD